MLCPYYSSLLTRRAAPREAVEQEVEGAAGPSNNNKYNTIIILGYTTTYNTM